MTKDLRAPVTQCELASEAVMAVPTPLLTGKDTEITINKKQGSLRESRPSLHSLVWTTIKKTGGNHRFRVFCFFLEKLKNMLSVGYCHCSTQPARMV